MIKCLLHLAAQDLEEAELCIEKMLLVKDEKDKQMLRKYASAAIERHDERHEHITEEPTCEVGKAYHSLVHKDHGERAARIKHILEKR